MKKLLRQCITPVLVTGLVFSSMTAMADGGKHHGDKNHSKNHYKHMQEIHGMLRDVMVILRDLNHKPSTMERNHLNAMVTRMDEIMADKQKMHEKKWSDEDSSNDD